MHYLFGFSGRINRAKMWLFLAVTLVWQTVNGVLFVLGLNWHECIEDCQSEAFKQADTGPKVGLLLLFLILFAAYLLSCASVYTKRLHDRDKSAWWLMPYLVIPCGLEIWKMAAGLPALDLGRVFGAFGFDWNAISIFAALLAILGGIELLFLRGTAGPNDYGPDPLD